MSPTWAGIVFVVWAVATLALMWELGWWGVLLWFVSVVAMRRFTRANTIVPKKRDELPP